MKTTTAVAALLWAIALPVTAESGAGSGVWDDIKSTLYGDRALLDGADVIAIDAPYRTYDDARTILAAQVTAPRGVSVASVTLVLDNNPMPVSARFDLERPMGTFYFDVTMRVNGPTPLHVIAETTDGRVWMSEGYVKTSGQGACAAPPGTDPELALATLGDMTIAMDAGTPGLGGGKLAAMSARLARLDIDISHPSHSGMQMDQISLLFIPMRYIERVEVDLDGSGFVTVTGSISLSENPRMALSVPQATRDVTATMTDTDGTVSEHGERLTGY